MGMAQFGWKAMRSNDKGNAKAKACRTLRQTRSRAPSNNKNSVGPILHTCIHTYTQRDVETRGKREACTWSWASQQWKTNNGTERRRTAAIKQPARSLSLARPLYIGTRYARSRPTPSKVGI